jgi:hypothetical protein
MNIPILVCFALARATCQAPDVGAFPMQSLPPSFEDSSVYSAVSIVEEVGRMPAVLRQADGERVPNTFRVDRVRVLSSGAFPSGAELTVLTPCRRGQRLEQPPTNHPILLVCSKPEGARLYLPVFQGENLSARTLYKSASGARGPWSCLLRNVRTKPPCRRRSEIEIHQGTRRLHSRLINN